MFLLIATALLGLVSAYVGVRLLPALPLGSTGRALGIVVLCLPVVFAAAGTLARYFSRPRLARLAISAGSLMLGWVSSLLVLTLVREIALALGLLLPAGAAASLSAWSALCVVLLAALATIVGYWAAMRPPRVLEVSIPLEDLPADLRGFTIVQISDLHVGTMIRRRHVERVVAIANRLAPDLVAVTGDLIDGEVGELAAQVAPLRRLVSRHGTYFVTGNHEYYSGAAAWMVELRRLGLRVLINEHVLIRQDAATLVLAGVTDTGAAAFDRSQASDPQAALRGAPPQMRPRILLAHRPRSAAAAERAGFDLQLSGHTHGGQFWPWNLVVRLQEPLAIGLDRLNRLWVYTSRGTGFWGPPQRLGVPAEITRLRLIRADVAQAARGAGRATPGRNER